VADLTAKQICDYANDRLVFIADDQDKATFVFKTKTGENKIEMKRN
jgi:hypothetical protein